MDIIVAEGRKVIKCEHCDGTTLCKHSVMVPIDPQGYYNQQIPRCSLCGDGIARHSEFFKVVKEAKPPICRACGGKGYTVL